MLLSEQNDQILQSNHTKDVLMRDTIQAIKQFPEHRQRAINITETAAVINLHPVFTERANVLLNALK